MRAFSLLEPLGKMVLISKTFFETNMHIGKVSHEEASGVINPPLNQVCMRGQP
jgi:hypothetical protein